MKGQGGGAIVNTASISGLSGDWGLAAYNAAKAAVINLTRTAAIELARHGIRVNCVCPGGIATPLVLGNGGYEGNGDVELEWIQRWIAEEPCHWWPTFSTVNLIRFPTGYHSAKVDWTLTGVLAKNVGPGTAYMNAWLKTANGDNNLEEGSTRWWSPLRCTRCRLIWTRPRRPSDARRITP
jgi:short-subunit dehydrogenase